VTTPAERFAAYEKRTAGGCSTTERGDALADYAAEALSTLKGVKLDGKKVISSDRSQEIDVVMWNERLPGKKGLRFLSHTIFVEAKNWDCPVGAAEVAWFKEKVRINGDYSGGGATGILLALSGVTGEKYDRDFAVAIIHSARGEKVRILVVRPSDLAVEPKTLREFFRQRVTDLASGKIVLPT